VGERGGNANISEFRRHRLDAQIRHALRQDLFLDQLRLG
jgi:hypothetical protein